MIFSHSKSTQEEIKKLRWKILGNGYSIRCMQRQQRNEIKPLILGMEKVRQLPYQRAHSLPCMYSHKIIMDREQFRYLIIMRIGVMWRAINTIVIKTLPVVHLQLPYRLDLFVLRAITHGLIGLFNNFLNFSIYVCIYFSK